MFSYLNVHALNLACTNPRFRTILNNAAVTYCDGEGVRLGARMLGGRLPPRTVLTYWIWDLCELFQEKGISVYFLGGTESVVAEAERLIASKFPRLRIAGSHHGYFAKSGAETARVIEDVNRATPDVLFVGFGMPAQEIWIDENRRQLHVGAILPSGSMIDYIAGTRTPAPGWMADHGFEWLFRFIKEPGRLWRRYIIGNPLFLVRVLGERYLPGRNP